MQISISLWVREYKRAEQLSVKDFVDLFHEMYGA